MAALLLEVKLYQISLKSLTTALTTLCIGRGINGIGIIAASSCGIIAVNIYCTLNDQDFGTVIGDIIFRCNNL